MPRTRHRIAAMVSIMCLVLFAVTGCAFGSGGAKKSFAKPPPTGLASYLETPPDQSSPANSSWAKNYEPSVKDFVGQFYSANVQTTVIKQLEDQGLTDVAHVLWLAADQVQSDIVLLQFATPGGAVARLAAVKNANAADSTLRSYTLPGRGSPILYYQPQADSRNNVLGKGYAVVGNILVEIFTYSRIEYAKGEVDLWLTNQIKLLP
jgi:hypothetical protein